MTADPFAEMDAAYVLGALSPEDRLAYEAHLDWCDGCARAVGELAGMPGLLARVPLAELEQPEPEPPATLLPSLGRAVSLRRRRARRRWVVAVGAVAASALAFTLTLGLGADRSGTPAPAPVPTGVALSRVAVTPLHASARIVDVSWGSQIDLTCTYDKRYLVRGDSYTLVVIDRAGRAQQVAAWAAVPGMVSRVSGASAWHRADIARLEVRTAAGVPVLRLTT